MLEANFELLLASLFGGGLIVTLLQRLFSTRDASKQAAAEKQQTIDEASVEFFKGLRGELQDCREENRRVNDKLDTQARDFYTLKGKYEAGQEQLERMTTQYFDLFQKYTAALLEREVLRQALKDNGIDVPDVPTVITPAPTESEAT